MRYLENYLERIKRKGNLTLADAISKTVIRCCTAVHF